MDQSWLVVLLPFSRLPSMKVGPLLWHWENNTTKDPSVELDLEEVKTLTRAVGFELSVSQFEYTALSI